MLTMISMVIYVSLNPFLSSRLNKSPKHCRLISALSQREQQQQLNVCLLVGDSIGTCGYAAANAEPRESDQHCQTSGSSSSSSSRAGTGEELCRPPAERNPHKRDRARERERERDLVTEQRMRMQWEGDAAEESARREKQTGGQAV